MTSRPAVIVLAAGKGSRFTGPDHKLSQELDGSTVLGTTLGNALATCFAVIVVTTEGLAELACRSVAARDVVVLPDVGAPGHPSLGMGFSIASGVAASPDASGWLILPGDMPRVLTATLQAVGQELVHHPVAYAQYRGRRGHPVGFSSELYSELVALSGDEGARRLTARYPAHGVEVDDAGILLDLDTEADLAVLRGTRVKSATTVSSRRR